MKLYGTISSERATKGQGGNKFLELRVDVGKENNSTRILYGRIDATENGYHLVLSATNEKGEQETLLNKIIKTKGEKLKTAKEEWECSCGLKGTKSQVENHTCRYNS